MPVRFKNILLPLWVAGAIITLSVIANQAQNASEPVINSVGIQLPPDAAPVEHQVLTRFELDNRYMDRATAISKQAFGVGLVAEPLTRIDGDFNLIPAAATHWEVTEDGYTWIYYIQPGLIFADGHPLTAYDYEATFRRWANPATGFDWQWYFQPIKNWNEVVGGRMPVDSVGAHALDEHTLAFTTGRPTPYLPVLLNKVWVTPTHLFDKYGPEWAAKPETHFGSGPYRLKEWRRAEQIVLVPNEKYRGPVKPILERIVAKLYNHTVSPQFLSSYEAGEVDYIPLNNQAEINRVKSDPMLRSQLNTYTDFATFYMMFNTYKPPFNDRRVRQAFSHAINQEDITKSALWNVGLPATSMLPPGFPSANPEALAHIQKFDPELARKRLAEAGYPNGIGFPSVDIWLRQETAVNRIGAEAVQAMLKQNLNIDVGVRNMERKVFAEALPTRELILGMVPYQYDYLDAGNLLTIWLSNGRHAWHNDRFEQLVLEANELVGDPDRRQTMYQEAERILVSDVGGVFLWYLQINQMWKPYIKGKAVEPNKWGYRAWRNDLMMHLSPTLYITKDVLKGRAKPQESKSIWQWLTGSIED